METKTGNKTPNSGGQVDAVVIPKFGSIVKFSEVYKRKEERRDQTWKVWKRYQKDDIGIFLGTRTLKNGIREFYYDEGYIFTPKEYLSAALVCPGPRENPVLVPIDSLKSV